MKGFFGQSNKPLLRVEKDGFPSGHASPEGAACDLARAFIQRKVALFKNTCIKPIGSGDSAKEYGAFLKQMESSFASEAKKKMLSPGGPKAIVKVFAARSLSKNGPTSMCLKLVAERLHHPARGRRALHARLDTL